MPWKQWKADDPITINRIIWDGIESEYVQDVFERDWFGPGKYAADLEAALVNEIGVKHVQLTNSGSSALLLATQALQKLGYWQPGDLILHPACTFPTSCNPIWQSGMIPVFVDVEEGTYIIDADRVEEAIEHFGNHIKGAIIPHLIGNIAEMDRIMHILGNRPLIEDSCDTMGGTYNGQPVGTFGHASAFSFYGSHHITTAGVGGALATSDDELYRLAKSMAFWGREFVTTNDPYYDFTQRYTYETVGYDMQMSEIQAAFGLAQMLRLPEIIDGRDKQFEAMHEFMMQWSEWLILPVEHDKAIPSWFGYPVLVKESAPFGREEIIRHLLKNKVEVRPLFAGNLTEQKAYKPLKKLIVGDLTQADRNMERAFFLPAWGGMTKAMTDRLFEIISEFMVQW